MEISLDGSETGRVIQPSWPGAVNTDGAVSFLAENPTAKIIVVVDTHCLDNGKFVWMGANTNNYQACDMDEVSVIYPYTITLLSHPFEDNQGLHPQAGPEVHVHSGQVCPQSQEYHHQPHLWSNRSEGPYTGSPVRWVSPNM